MGKIPDKTINYSFSTFFLLLLPMKNVWQQMDEFI